ncbi:MAG: cytochrome b/b6 domain-containing protein [Sterolibacteriaceae bacterium]|uniref:Cytochrome b/b6 domain-containing protein n=1 Tax=Candidatus Methylophosphatis roskildensis TaxID=2899263 RepID=A0A9D7DW21_9PROT|nr:cytochrome b/b6 domain-containing protein [Candidatus Methylophosphatis roskildensis]
MSISTAHPDGGVAGVTDQRDGANTARRILVWDLPTRIGHWLLAGSFALAWLTAESESWRNVHVASGYLFGAVIAFRLVWGFVGTRYARFTQFVKSPRAAWQYLMSLPGSWPQHTVGHNPAGGWAIVALLALGAISVVSGWLSFNEIGGELFEELHEGASTAALAVVLIHLVGVATGSLVHRENLVASMFSGYKRGAASAAIAGARGWAALVLVIWTSAVVTFLMR